MPRAYWVVTYRAIRDPDALADYAKVSRQAVEAAGGRIIARGDPVAVLERGVPLRAVVIEFESVAAAQAAYDSPGYQKALALLGDSCDRDIRIVEAA
jgi:uncharacterized protein (DUF1330 family)